MPTTTLDQLAGNVLQRLQDDTGIFWDRQNEVVPACAEAISDLLLLVGRPTQVTSQVVTLTPNTVWQDLPTGLLLITDVRTDQSRLRKTSLHEMDYTQASNGPDWTADRDDTPQKWGPLGLSGWFVWPAPTTAIQITIAGIALPIQSPWPFDASTQSCFHQEIDVALELYGASYCRLKELGNDAAEGNVLRQQYVAIAQQLTKIEDRRDPMIFSAAVGVNTSISQVGLR